MLQMTYLSRSRRLRTLLLLGLEVLLLRSEKKRYFSRLYGDTQRSDFRPLEDKNFKLHQECNVIFFKAFLYPL
jgi:hypothetical protein